MGAFEFLLIVLAIIGILAICYIIIYNKLQIEKTKIEHAENLIDENLRSKYDIMVRANDVIKKDLKDKKEYLKEYIDLKEKKISNFNLDRELTQAENIIANLCNDNPELEKNENMIEITYDFKMINEKLTACISYYNKQMNLLNGYIRKFPNNIIAKLHNVKSKPFFDGKDMTDNDIEDFKL